jgi:hypothetical protein
MGGDTEPGGFANRADAKTKDFAAIDLKRPCRMVPGLDQQATECQHRRVTLCGDPKCGAAIRADEFAADRLWE